MLTFDIAGAQIDGARDYQEDAFLVTHLGDSDGESGSLVIVADGMGGHAAGNVASNMAVQTFNKHITSNFPTDEMPAVLRESALEANNSITETVRETAALKGMGCTLVAAVLENSSLRWVSVGDSHLYLIRNDEVKKKNADHSYGGFLDRMAAEGNPVEPEAGFSRNMLMSALTGEEIADIDCPETPLELEGGDRIIIASDGLDTLSHGKMLSYINTATTAKECVDALLAGVEEAKMPRQDNTTVIVVDVQEKEDPVQQTAVTIPAATEPATEPPQPFAVEDDQPSGGGGMALIIAAVVAFVLLGGGAAFWFMSSGPAPTAIDEELIVEVEPELAVEEDLTAVEEEVAEPDTADAEDAEPVAETEADTAPPIVPDDAASVVPAGEAFADALKSGGKGPQMIWIPGARYAMGARAGSAAADQNPQHTVGVPAFAMSTHEITIAQYRRFAKATGRKVPKTGELDANAYPVFYVSWNDALAYTMWLSTQTGAKYRLPTEAQWEYAARAGTTSNYWWGRNLGVDNAHCFACETGLDPRRPTRVGRFKANKFGLFDTSGNVQEWVYDCHHANYQGAPGDGSVFEGGDCSVRVVRGGAYSSGTKALHSSARDKFRFDAGNDSIGIRVVREP
jgi:formylglycine-generating enzyme required for sulfatase activity/serine/threonine protein phosphatase PrpC